MWPTPPPPLNQMEGDRFTGWNVEGNVAISGGGEAAAPFWGGERLGGVDREPSDGGGQETIDEVDGDHPHNIRD